MDSRTTPSELHILLVYDVLPSLSNFDLGLAGLAACQLAKSLGRCVVALASLSGSSITPSKLQWLTALCHFCLCEETSTKGTFRHAAKFQHTNTITAIGQEDSKYMALVVEH